MGLNFIGIPMTLMFIASVAGIIFGLLKKNKKVLNASLILFAVMLAAYIILFVIFN